jgi:hypothetical protein
MKKIYALVDTDDCAISLHSNVDALLIDVVGAATLNAANFENLKNALENLTPEGEKRIGIGIDTGHYLQYVTSHYVPED